MSQTPVVFLPGTLCDERIWLKVWSQLSVNRRYVPLQWATSFDDMMMLTDDRMSDSPKAHVVGYSMGGYVAAKWAQKNPGKLASLTLIGYDPAGLADEEVKRRKQMLTMLSKGQFKPDHPAYISRFVHPDHQANPQVAGMVSEMGADLGKATLIAHTNATTPRDDMRSFLTNAPFPVHFLCADSDEIADAKAISKFSNPLPHSTFTCFEQAGHMMPLEIPQQIAASISEIVRE